MRRRVMKKRTLDRIASVVAVTVFLSWMVGFAGGLILQSAEMMLGGVMIIGFTLLSLPMMLSWFYDAVE